MRRVRSSASCPEQLKAGRAGQKKREQCRAVRCGDFCKEGTGAASFSRQAPRMSFTRETFFLLPLQKNALLEIYFQVVTYSISK